MRKVNLISVIITLLFFLSCSSENPVEVKENLLEKNILGFWTDNENYSIQFYDNGSFKDSILFKLESDRHVAPTILVRKGKYIIQNDILLLTEFYLEEAQLGEIGGVLFHSQEYEIDISNNIIKRTPIMSFNSQSSSNNQLWGKWISNGWQCGYTNLPDSESVNGSGIFNRTYEFLKDSTKFKAFYETDFPQYGIKTSLIEYSYNYPLLEMPNSFPNKVEVEFSNNRMIWYYKDERALTNNLYKIE